jgi:NADPH-dependent ferric siderophore reductase
MHGRVRAIEWPTPIIARVTLDGDGLAGFSPLPYTDSYVNVAIPPAGAPYDAPFALDDLRSLPREQRPFRRRYTVRRWEAAARRLTLEFVVHSDEGAAGPWAAGAHAGDALVFTGPAGAYRPDPEADWHLMVGDESALPAIAASLEEVPADAPVLVRLVCDGPDHELALETPGRLDLVWLHRDSGSDGTEQLAREVSALDFPNGKLHAFVHGEAGETRAVRRHLLAERGVDPDRLSCSPYWRRGMTDEAWREIKAGWNADVARDVA